MPSDVGAENRIFGEQMAYRAYEARLREKQTPVGGDSLRLEKGVTFDDASSLKECLTGGMYGAGRCKSRVVGAGGKALKAEGDLNPDPFDDYQFYYNIVLFVVVIAIGAWYIYGGFAFFKGSKYAGAIAPSDVGRATLMIGWVLIIGLSYAATYLSIRASRDYPEIYRNIFLFTNLAVVGTIIWSVGFTFGSLVLICIGNIFNIAVTCFRIRGAMDIYPLSGLFLVPFLILNVMSLVITLRNLPGPQSAG